MAGECMCRDVLRSCLVGMWHQPQLCQPLQRRGSCGLYSKQSKSLGVITWVLVGLWTCWKGGNTSPSSVGEDY